MHAKAGDWLVIESRTVGHVVRRGQILEIRGADGTPPYVVRWTDNDHVATVYPGPDAHVLTSEELAERDRIGHLGFEQLA